MIHKTVQHSIATICFILIAMLPMVHAQEPLPLQGRLSSARLSQGGLPVQFAGARVSERIFGLTGLSNVGRVARGIYRGAQPEAAGYATLQKLGIRTVINLRTTLSEKKEVEAAGMRSIEVPLNILRDPDPLAIRKVVALLADPANQPVFVHCRQGQDRTGAVVAVYRMEMEGWAMPEAAAEMQAFGFNNIWHDLKKFVREYKKAPVGQ